MKDALADKVYKVEDSAIKGGEELTCLRFDRTVMVCAGRQISRNCNQIACPLSAAHKLLLGGRAKHVTLAALS